MMKNFEVGERGLTIPFEVADGITLANLQDNLEYLQTELDLHKNNGEWLHPTDAYNSEFKLIPALKTIIEFYGGEVK